jgi:hypothetical protein
MPISIPGDLNGEQAETLRRLLYGDGTFFSARVNVDGRDLLIRIAAEARENTVTDGGPVRKNNWTATRGDEFPPDILAALQAEAVEAVAAEVEESLT